MIFPAWVPREIIEYLADLVEYRSREGLSKDELTRTLRSQEMWMRLATRPEMEMVWGFILGFGYMLPLRANGGLLGRIETALENYEDSPKFSPKAYEQEMNEISKLAETLARKLRKFSDAGSVFNPFPFDSLLSEEQISQAKGMLHPRILAHPRLASGFALTYHLPSFDQQLDGLTERAKEEAIHQAHRLRLPRKVNDKNTFRTYFIQMIRDYFFCMYADYAPSRLAIFCSVALDDPCITANLIGKMFPLNDEEKAMFKANLAQPED